MRTARSLNGFGIEGDGIIPYRAPLSIREREETSLSFAGWDVDQPLPEYQDHITGHQLGAPLLSQTGYEKSGHRISHYVSPDNPSFGPPSTVKVPRYQPEEIPIDDTETFHDEHDQDIDEHNRCVDDLRDTTVGMDDELHKGRVRRSDRKSGAPAVPVKRRPVKDRWYYERIEDSGVALLSKPTKEHEELRAALDFGIVSAELTANTMISPGPPSVLGELDVISKADIDLITPNEKGACALQGMMFHDNDLSWCRITGWGIESGIIILFYSPVNANDAVIEKFTCIDDMLLLLKGSDNDPVVPRFGMARMLMRSPSDQYSLCYRQKHDVPLQSCLAPVGSYVVRTLGAKVGSYNGKLLTLKIICRIMRAQDTMFKYGTMIPRNDAEASRSPEAVRWLSGKQLEWLRLKQATTFETQWTWDLIRRHYPTYAKSDIGHMFFIYDYKYSGEHRVRLVFDGSRQSSATFNETYAPTVRSESVRLFHMYAVEYAWNIQQYDVPQAFLRSKADCDIFCYPPNGFAEFPGQLLKLAKMLYGSKQAAALWYNLINTFLLEMRFQSSEMRFQSSVTLNALNLTVLRVMLLSSCTSMTCVSLGRIIY